MAVIELGSVHHDDAASGPSARPPAPRRLVRQVLVLVVTAFCLLTATGSSRPDPHGPAELWSVPFQEGTDGFVVSGGTAFVLTRAAMTAYDVRTGAVRWTRPGVPEPSWLRLLASGVLLLPAATTSTTYSEADGSIISRDFVSETVAVDAATGRDLWRQPGEVAAATADRAMLTRWAGNGRAVASFRTVRLRDGGTVWTRPGRELETWVADTTLREPGVRVAFIDTTGRTEVVDVTDGAVLATAKLPWDGPALADRYPNAMLIGHRLFLTRGRYADRASLAAYDTDTLREQWHARQDPQDALYGCGPVLCLQTRAGTTARDRATGALLWQSAGSSGSVPLGDHVLLSEDEGALRLRMVDATTGRQRADLGTALPVLDEHLDVPYVISWPAGPAESMLVSRLDADTGEIVLRGRIPVMRDFRCHATGRLLTCVTADNRLATIDLG